MGRHGAEHIPLPAEVLHELRRQFDCVPLHAIDAGYAHIVDPGQHMVQPVPGLVKQRDDFIVREAGRLAVHRCGEVAGQISHWRLHPAIDMFVARARVVHPRAAALAFTRVQVEIELRDQLACRRFNAEKAHVGVPYRRLVRADGHAEQRFDDTEQSGQHRRLREILFHFVLRKRIAFFAQAFRGE